MEYIRSKKQLAVRLSKLIQIEEVNQGLEQYQTESELAADMIWQAFMLGDIEDKEVWDLGAGNGVFGIGAALLGASKVVFVEKDTKAIDILKKNIEAIKTEEDMEGDNYEVIEADIEKDKDIIKPCDTIIMNPPFGTKEAHADKKFLEKAINAKVVYSLHKIESDGFLKAFAKDNNLYIDKEWICEFPIRRSHVKHKRDRYIVKVVFVRIIHN